MRLSAISLSTLFFVSVIALASTVAQDHSVLEIRDKLERGAVNLHTATGFAFLEQGDYTYFMSAAHVVKERKHLIIAYYRNRIRQVVLGEVVFKDKDMDVAVVKVLTGGRDFPIFDLMSKKDFEKLPKAKRNKKEKKWEGGALVMIAGYPGNKTPLITIGRLIDRKAAIEYLDPEIIDIGEGIEIHTATSWFGFSGGPVIDVKSGKAVGVQIYIYSDRTRNHALSDLSGMRSVPEIWDTIKDWLKGVRDED